MNSTSTQKGMFPSHIFQRRIPKGIPEQLEKVGEHLGLFLNGKPNDRIHSGFILKSLSAKKELRLPLAMTGDFIESVCLVLSRGEDSDASRRCQQHALSIIINIQLEDPVLDTFIAHEENCLPGIAKALKSEYQLTQELASTALDYACVMEDNRSLVCFTEGMLDSMTILLRNTNSLLARTHCLQAFVYLSEHPRNRFLLSRNKEVLDEVEESFFVMDEKVVSLSTKFVYELSRARENIVKLVEHPELLMRILDIFYEVDLRKLYATPETKDMAKGIVTAVENRFAHGSGVNIKDILARFNSSIVGSNSHVTFADEVQSTGDEDEESEETGQDESHEGDVSQYNEDKPTRSRSRRSATIVKQRRAKQTLEDALDEDFDFHIPEGEVITPQDIFRTDIEPFSDDDDSDVIDAEPHHQMESEEMNSVRAQLSTLVGDYGSDDE